MERAPVESSQIRSIGYDAGARKLHVEFIGFGGKPGSVYEYTNVEPETHAQLIRTHDDDGKKWSVGRYFGKTIKGNPQRYPYKKLGQPKV